MINSIKQELLNYLALYPNESVDLQRLCVQLDNADSTIFARSNMHGHITSSALLLNPSCDKALLIHHNTYNKLIAPGGHIDDPTQSLVDSAYREVDEETGFIINSQTVQLEKTILLDVDTHHIAPNIRKNEGAHWHHDFLYLVYATDADMKLVPQLLEVKDARWGNIKDFRKLIDPRYTKIANKLDIILNPSFDAPMNVSVEIGKILSLSEYIYELKHKILSCRKELEKSMFNEALFDIDTIERSNMSTVRQDLSTTHTTLVSLLEDITVKKTLEYTKFCEFYPNYVHVLNRELNLSLKEDLNTYPIAF